MDTNLNHRTIGSFLRVFSREEQGATATIIALSLFVLIGFAALAIDMSYANSTRTELQVTASAAALAGVQQIVDSNGDGVVDNDDYRTGAVEYAYRNMPLAKHGNIVESTCGTYTGGAVSGSSECGDIKVGNWAAATRTFTPWDDATWEPVNMVLDAVRVRAHRAQANGNPLGLFLAPAVGLAEQDINVSAIAWAEGLYLNSCLVTLDPSAPQSLHVQGNATIVSDGCGICVNSDDPGGLWLNGNPGIHVEAADFVVSGSDFHIQGAADIFPSPSLNNAAGCIDPFVGATPFAEDFNDASCAAGTPATSYNGGDFNQGGGTVSISPGLHCGGITFKANGNVVFEPGIHHIKNGDLLEVGNHTYSGEGVTFLIDNATLDFRGSQDVELSAGPSGFLFYENPDGPRPTDEHIFRGDADSDYEGIIYTPDRNIEFVGNSYAGVNPPDCFAVIANQIHFTGTTDMQLSGAGCGEVLETSSVTTRLVD